MSENKKIKLFDDKEIMQWACDNDCLNTIVTFNTAAKTGNINALEWAHSKKYPCDECVVKTAIKYGQLEAFKWLYKNNYKLDNFECAVIAATYGQINMLKIFLDEDITSLPIHNKDVIRCQGLSGIAARNGQLDVLKWLYEKKLTNFGFYTTDEAYFAKQTHVLDWFKSINSPYICDYHFDIKTSKAAM